MKIFYGWWVLLGLFLIYTANNGILIYTLPLFYPELIDEFGWNAEQVTRPAALLLVVAAIIVPFAGIRFTDNHVRRYRFLDYVVDAATEHRQSA